MEEKISAQSLRLIQVISSDSFGGVEQYVARVSSSLASRGHSVTVIGGSNAEMQRALGGAPIQFVPADSIAQAAFSLIRRGWVTKGADLVHAHMVDAEIAAIATKMVLRKPVFATLHFAQKRGRTPARRELLQGMARFIDVQLAISEFVAMESGQVCEVLPLGVPDVGGGRSLVPNIEMRSCWWLNGSKRKRGPTRHWTSGHLAGLREPDGSFTSRGVDRRRTPFELGLCGSVSPARFGSLGLLTIFRSECDRRAC